MLVLKPCAVHEQTRGLGLALGLPAMQTHTVRINTSCPMGQTGTCHDSSNVCPHLPPKNPHPSHSACTRSHAQPFLSAWTRHTSPCEPSPAPLPPPHHPPPHPTPSAPFFPQVYFSTVATAAGLELCNAQEIVGGSIHVMGSAAGDIPYAPDNKFYHYILAMHEVVKFNVNHVV
jgi:hypothetical protein